MKTNTNTDFLSSTTHEQRGTHTAAQVEKDLDIFREAEEPTQKHRDNLLQSLASNSIDVAIFNRSRAEAGKRIEEGIKTLAKSVEDGFKRITDRQEITNGRINSLQEWREVKDKLDENQSKMIEETMKLHNETVKVLEEVKGRLNLLERTDIILSEAVDNRIAMLEAEDKRIKRDTDKFSKTIQKLKEWKIKIMVGAGVVIFLFKYDFIQIPDKYINIRDNNSPIVKSIDKKHSTSKADK